MSVIDLNTILKIAVKEGASDIHIKVGLPPILRMHGNLFPIKNCDRLSPDDISNIAMSLMTEPQREVFRVHYQVDLAHGVSGLGRFRVNIFRQRGSISINLRVIPMKIRSLEELHMPGVLENIAMEQRGLVLATGVTGSGKSTTLASMLNYINTHRTCHIITIEDPIEFLHKDKKSIINQREVGVDTRSFAESLRAALRQDPDVIMVGEMRDLETIEIALTAAETGHLVFSTLHTIDATETINRIVSAFPPYQQEQIRIQLAGVIKGIISQRLVPTKDGKGRVAAVEILVSTATIREYIEDKERTKEIADAISKGHITYGMQTFDQSIMRLYKEGLISFEEALKQASNPSDFRLKVKGITSDSNMGWKDFGKEKETTDRDTEELEIDRF